MVAVSMGDAGRNVTQPLFTIVGKSDKNTQDKELQIRGYDMATALRQFAENTPQHVQVKPTVPDEWRGVLNHLRVIALGCRAAARTNLFTACAMLSTKQDTARDAHAHALLRCLDQAIAVRPTFYRPGVDAVSFDEAWLIRAITAAKQGDTDSFAFLIRARVPKLHQRHIAFLIKGISEQFTHT